jgi:hypothetical protein
MTGQGTCRRWTIAPALAGVCLAAAVAPAQARIAKRPLTTGFADSKFISPDAGVRAHWLGEARKAGAGIVRIGVSWRGIAPLAPSPTFNPSNPADPQYRWKLLDAAVREATARGFRILLTVATAPAWAEGPGRPASAKVGTWRPDPGQFAAFGAALASRYSGGFPDPRRPGHVLPAVRAFEAWNEPNISDHLTPQWVGGEPVGAEQYRSMLDRFYTSVKAVQPAARIVMGGMEPYGDAPGGLRTQPVTFARILFCVGLGTCPEPARFDVFGHHPINTGDPLQSGPNHLDATTPDLGRLKRVLRDGERTGGVAPPFPKPVWATELWWDTNPPDPGGVSLKKQARWIAEAIYILWRQGAKVVIFLPLADSLPVPDYPSTLQSGVFFADGRRKPSLKAFRFPFVARRVGHGKVQVWGKPPRRAKVKVQRRVGHRWHTIHRLRGSGRAPFVKTLMLRGRPRLRARSHAATSRPYKTRSIPG